MICETCEKQFDKKGATRFCCRDCYSKWRSSVAKKGSVVTCQVCGEDTINKSSRPEGTKYCSRECAGKAHSMDISKEKHPNWKGGISPRDITKTGMWRDSVFQRDNYTCQKCHAHGVNLNAHHILGYARYVEARFKTSNGITLCVDCHIDFHNTYTRSRFTEEDLEEFLKE